MFTVSPSIYSADLLNLKAVLDQAKDFEHLHLDIDDGNFVKGISFGAELVRQIAASTEVPLDVHLEVLNPLDHIDDLAAAGVKLIFAHIEVLPFPLQFLSKVRNSGVKAGLALNLKTAAEAIEPYIDQIDHLLLLSTEADEDGLIFRKSVLNKVRKARKLLPDNVPIWVDGGVNEENLKDIIASGADGVVIGRAVFGSKDFKKAYDHFIRLGRIYETKEKGEESDVV